MATTIKSYKVFISSPADMSPEREVLRQVVSSLAPSLERRGLALAVWSFDRDAVSDFGRSPQDIITRQLGSYDIYVGIMGIRFGSPTESYGSGTEEEFNDALNTSKINGFPRIGFFFKQVAVNSLDLSDDDIDQLRKVRDFRTSIGSAGLYREFRDKSELQTALTSFLNDELDREEGATPVVRHPKFGLTTSTPETRISRSFFDENLNKIDENITSDGVHLTLDDIWIIPDLRLENETDAENMTVSDAYDYTALVADVRTSRSFIVMGDETSGKTSLCRKLYADLFKSGSTPVLLDGLRINNPDLQRLEQRVRLAHQEQYDTVGSGGEIDLNIDGLMVIIDNYDQAKLSPTHSCRLLAAIMHRFRCVVITCAKTFEFNFLESNEDATTLSSLKRASISNLSHRKRYDLIEKWCLSGRIVHDEGSLRTQVEQKRRVINRVLSSNLVPRTPIIVLILLRAMDLGQVGDLAKTGYVRYYKFLIDSAILRNISSVDAEAAYALLPEMAWKMYLSGSKEMSPEEAEAVIEEFANRRALRKTLLYSALASCQRIGMFVNASLYHKFRHSYTYYYFLADYISKNLQSEEMKKIVENLCQDVAVKESANILVFLAFHSDDDIIIRNLMNGLNSTFSTVKQFEFDKDQTSAVNRLIRELPKQVVDFSRSKQRRNERLDEEELNEQSRVSRNVEEEPGEEFLSPVIRVFTSVEILGHILRNHYARIDSKPKQAILHATSSAILRCTGEIFATLSNSVEPLVLAVRAFTDKFDSESDDLKRETLAKRVVFIVAAAMLMQCVRHLARSVGDENLEMTFRQAIEDSPTLVKKYIDVIIRLDAYREFPVKSLEDVTRELKDNHLAMAALRFSVAERLDMRPPTRVHELQKICGLVGLDIKSRLIVQQRK